MNIDWKVLGAVIWSVFKVLGTLFIGFGLFFAAMVYLPGSVLLGLFFFTLIVWWIVLDYKARMFAKGKHRE